LPFLKYSSDNKVIKIWPISCHGKRKKAGVPVGIATSFVFVTGKTLTTPFVYKVHEKTSWI
jgi:hypothetical protein